MEPAQNRRRDDSLPGRQPGEPRSLPRGDIEHYGAASWLSDEKQILFSGQRKGEQYRCYLQNLETGVARGVSDQGADICVPAPGGTTFVATAISLPFREPKPVRPAFGPGSASAIYQLDGSEPQRAVPGMADGDVPLQWSADGRFLYVRRSPAARNFGPHSGPVEIDRVNVSTGVHERWKTLAPSDRAGLFVMDDPLITPDGRSYVYDYARFLHELYVVTGLK